MPNPALGGGGVLTATAAPTTTAATATAMSTKIKSCWRHSRLERRQAQRIMALAATFTRRIDGVTRTRTVPGGVELHVQGVDRLVPRVVEAAEAEGFALADLSVAEPTLETVFIGLTGKELRD